MRPTVQTFFDPATSTASYLVFDPATRDAAIVDPVLDYEPKAARISTCSADAILAAASDQHLALRFVLETHAHADHLSAADYLRRKTGAKIVIGAAITEVQKTFIPRFEAEDVAADGRAFDRLVNEGDTLPLGETEVRVLHTPGHTAACVSYVIGDAAFWRCRTRPESSSATTICPRVAAPRTAGRPPSARKGPATSISTRA